MSDDLPGIACWSAIAGHSSSAAVPDANHEAYAQERTREHSDHSSFSLWETKDDAEAGGAAITDKTAGTLHELALEPPEFRVYEIYKPKA